MATKEGRGKTGGISAQVEAELNRARRRKRRDRLTSKGSVSAKRACVAIGAPNRCWAAHLLHTGEKETRAGRSPPA